MKLERVLGLPAVGSPTPSRSFALNSLFSNVHVPKIIFKKLIAKSSNNLFFFMFMHRKYIIFPSKGTCQHAVVNKMICCLVTSLSARTCCVQICFSGEEGGIVNTYSNVSLCSSTNIGTHTGPSRIIKSKGCQCIVITGDGLGGSTYPTTSHLKRRVATVVPLDTKSSTSYRGSSQRRDQLYE